MLKTEFPVLPAVQLYQTSEAMRTPQGSPPSVVAPALSPLNGPVPEMFVAVAQLSLPPLTKLLWLGPFVGAVFNGTFLAWIGFGLVVPSSAEILFGPRAVVRVLCSPLPGAEREDLTCCALAALSAVPSSATATMLRLLIWGILVVGDENMSSRRTVPSRGSTR